MPDNASQFADDFMGSSGVGPAKTDHYTDTTVEPMVSDLEKQIASLQFEVARGLNKKVTDPRVMDFIYKNLPSDKMSVEDRAKYTNEYAQIKQKVTEQSMQLANQAFGQKLDDLVSRGVMSQEAATEQKMKNTAAVSAVMKIYNKRLDAARMGMARRQFFDDAAADMNTARIANDVDQRNREILNNVISRTLTTLANRQGLEVFTANRAMEAQLNERLNKIDTQNQLIGGLAKVAAPIVNNMFQPKQTPMFNQGGYEGLGIGNPASYTPQGNDIFFSGNETYWG